MSSLENQERKIELRTREGVNVSDYYSDTLLDCLLPFLDRYPERKSLLEIGSGRRYISIVLAKRYKNLQVIATDIEDTAIALITENAHQNGLNDRITVRKGSLYEPVQNESFDLIVAVPPQIPLTQEQLEILPQSIASYHATTSIAGTTGRDVINPLISQAREHLRPGGIICFVRSDFSNPQKSLEELAVAGLKSLEVGSRDKLLSETKLTFLAKELIEQTGYAFKKDSESREYFTIRVLVGICPD